MHKNRKYVKFAVAVVEHTACLEVIWVDPRIFSGKKKGDMPRFTASNGWLIRQHPLCTDPVNKVDEIAKVIVLSGPPDSGRLRLADCRINALAEQTGFEIEQALDEFNVYMEVYCGKFRRNLRWIDRRKQTDR